MCQSVSLNNLLIPSPQDEVTARVSASLFFCFLILQGPEYHLHTTVSTSCPTIYPGSIRYRARQRCCQSIVGMRPNPSSSSILQAVQVSLKPSYQHVWPFRSSTARF